MKFHPQWDVPDADQVLSYIRERYPDESNRLDMEKALAFTAMYSQSILGEDVEDAEVPGLTPEMVNFFNKIDLKGNPIERGLKVAEILYEEGEHRMQHLLEEFGPKTLEGLIGKAVDRIEQEWEEGKGGDSHQGAWFGGMEVQTPIRMSETTKKEVIKLAKELRAFKSFDLMSRKSNKLTPDDWGDEDVLEFGIPEDASAINPAEIADDDLFDYLFMTKSFRYFESYSRKTLPRHWLVLIDDSGSMNNTQKISWVMALLSVIAEDIIKSDGVAYIAMFEEDLSPFWKMDSRESIQAFMTQFRGGHGGDTDIQGALKNVATQLRTGTLEGWDGISHNVPSELEIFIVNDGQDDIDSDFVPPAKTHSLMLYNSPTSENTVALANAVKRSGGNAHLVTAKEGLTNI